MKVIIFQDINGHFIMFSSVTPFVMYESKDYNDKKKLVVQLAGSERTAFYVKDEVWDEIYKQVEGKGE